MPTAIDPQPLVDAAKCFSCAIPEGLIQYVILAAISDLANGDPVPSDAADLMSEARCLRCVPEGMVPYAILGALVALSGGGGGGSGQIKTYVADPNGEAVVPDDQTLPAVAYQIAGAGPTVTWNTGTLLWQ